MLNYNFKIKQVSLFIFLIFCLAFLYLFAYSEAIKFTFRLHNETKRLKQLSNKVEELRIKEVSLASATRIYKIMGSRKWEVGSKK
ncbi:hypothetical protein KAW65_04870 [candidate division WOR-3 bacterium]|nr:hypothetical protein [candidate division WOR-3 bacterium]